MTTDTPKLEDTRIRSHNVLKLLRAPLAVEREKIPTPTGVVMVTIRVMADLERGRRNLPVAPDSEQHAKIAYRELRQAVQAILDGELLVALGHAHMAIAVCDIAEGRW